MKKIILMSTVLLAGLSACEDYNDQFNIDLLPIMGPLPEWRRTRSLPCRKTRKGNRM